MIHLRSLTAADIAAIKKWPSYEQDFSQMDYALREKGWLDEFRDKPDARLYAVESGSDVFGFSLLSISKNKEAEFRIALHPRHLGRGVGREAAFATLDRGFRQFGLEQIHLIVRKNNPRAVRLYERAGFTRTGESVHTIQGKDIQFIDMAMTRNQFETRPGKMNMALLLVDLQQDYFPNGKMELVGAVEAGRVAGKLLNLFRERSLPIIHIRHISTRPNAGFFLPHTPGIEFHESVAPLPGEAVVEKHFPNSFRGTTLEDHLSSRGISSLVICGMMSHMCIDATVRAAVDKGYTCHVVHDACATRSLAFLGTEIPAAQVHGAYMAALGAVYAKIASEADIAAFLRNG